MRPGICQKFQGVEILILLSANTIMRVTGIGIEFQPMPGLISYTGVTRGWGPLLVAELEVAVRCLKYVSCMAGNSEVSVT